MFLKSRSSFCTVDRAAFVITRLSAFKRNCLGRMGMHPLCFFSVV